MGIKDDHYYLALCIWLGINTAYGFVILCLFICTLYIGTRNYGQTALRWLNVTSMSYVFAYFIGYACLLAFGVGNYILSHDSDNQASMDSLRHEYKIAYYVGIFVFSCSTIIFLTMMNFRLKETFEDTSYPVGYKVFISIHIGTFVALIMIVLYEIIDLSDVNNIYTKGALVFLCVFIIIDLLIEIVLMYSFATKLYKVYKLNVKVYGLDNNIDINTESNRMSRLAIESTTRQCLLSIIAMICECIFLIGTLVRYILQIIQDSQSFEYNIAVWYIAVIPTWIKILCIYLSFGYTSNSYDRLCALCHHELKNWCRNAVLKNIQDKEYQYRKL